MHGLKPLGMAAALACSLVLMTGSALAAPPSTPPGQEKRAEEQQPPGQEKKAEAASVPAAAEQSVTPAAAPENKGQEQKAAKASSSSTTKTQGINSTSAGVKPSNSTAKNTRCWTGGSMPSPTCRREPAVQPADSSKRYGNGTTAAQIAVSRGASTDTEIRGPGNSQPHKVCGKNGNWVDVHAVKSYAGICVETTQAPGPSAAAPPARNVTSTPGVSIAAPTTAAGAASGAAVGPGAVAGVQGELGSSGGPAAAGGAGGVQGAFGVLGAAGTLPFTGLALWTVVLIGLVALALGLTLRRRVRSPLRSLV